MDDEALTFQQIVDECPIDPLTHACEWVKWVRDDGYQKRMHGGILHGLIVDLLVSYSDQQNKLEVTEITEIADKKSRLATFKKPWRIEDNMIVDANDSWVAALAGSCSREDDELLAQHICDCVNSK